MNEILVKKNNKIIEQQKKVRLVIAECFTKALLYDKNTYGNLSEYEKDVLLSMWETALEGYTSAQIKEGFNYELKQNNYQIKPSAIASYINEQRHIDYENLYGYNNLNSVQTKEEYEKICKSNELMFKKEKKEINSDEQSYLDNCYQTKSWREW